MSCKATTTSVAMVRACRHQPERDGRSRARGDARGAPRRQPAQALAARHAARRIQHEHLDYYLDEFTFRFNRRRARHRGQLFYRLIEGGLLAGPHPYATLITERSAA